MTSRYKKTRSLGKTIQVSKSGKIGVFLTASANIVHTDGPRGEFRCAATACTGWSTNIGVVTTTEGHYENLDDVDGKSFIKMWSTGYFGITWTYGSIYEKPGASNIGDLTRTSWRRKWQLPVSYAEMNGDCIKSPCSRKSTNISTLRIDVKKISYFRRHTVLHRKVLLFLWLVEMEPLHKIQVQSFLSL